MTRLVGRHVGRKPGPKLLVTTLMHGNEPAGRDAASRVLARLSQGDVDLSGELVVLVGNTRASQSHVRFVDKDLNRQFTPERVDHLRRSSPSQRMESEDIDAWELLQVLDEELRPGEEGAYFLDLHTTSAPGIPFVLFGDTLRNRKWAESIPLTKILGLEEQLDGTLLEHIGSTGWVTLGCEGGQHDDPVAVDNLEAVLWLAMVGAGMIPEDAHDLGPSRRRLESARSGRPPIIEVRYRHPITPRDQFRMRPGFTSLDPVDTGTLLAMDVEGEIRARWDGWLLMPLYQGQGSDGFFLASQVKPFWLELSAVLRRLRLDTLLRILPGVSAHPDRPATLVVDTKVARIFPLEIFHLFGYRKLRSQGHVLLVSRRLHDLTPPW
ncbi:MAG: succinylglutamate desuccinylase/aspartoacylase family protein [Candidatus Eisenbacteria bacterium]|uniref:Succinylglutamate desuccinylase/aspartoacylase family protein n=1 Tax=Eiseniibacteriota bacterium TaxID=2212470 RepID=A0A956NFM0_UNCEI|nr:succinylglutamate desuccinylase/aspartoacylase family protein [Candidatus Eisenbacteria bacterium]MCB9463308.1 succinylglutamate desuccinylase/aspartoacylase family protein [Candidatus Eisenbacteria bacterium]